MPPEGNGEYWRACWLAEQGRYDEARALYERLEAQLPEGRLRALVLNDLGAISAVEGDLESARQRFTEARAADEQCESARQNLSLCGDARPARPAVASPQARPQTGGPVRVSILSFLFNWPSTGGGIIHTVELARFLTKAGYDVHVVHPRYEPWNIGRVDASCPIPVETLPFESADWTVETVQRRFREAVDRVGPDYVLITDTWNFKPHLADAVRDYPCVWRMQALECLCPLNNLRLLPGEHGGFRQCDANQLAASETCRSCLARHAAGSGGLHQLERSFSGVGTPEYDRLLRRTLNEAEAVLVLNPGIADLLRPHTRRVEVVTWGMDPDRFPRYGRRRTGGRDRRTRILFAGLRDEPIKGFDVLHRACRKLWDERQDFELVVTADPPVRTDAFTRQVGWQTQERLPAVYHDTDVCVVPTIAQDGLSRTSVEAMASGRPVVASRLGGLPHTVMDGVTGLLFEPGDADDLAAKLRRLLDQPRLRAEMGRAGRKQFEERFTWPGVIEREYRRLLVRRVGDGPAERAPDNGAHGSPSRVRTPAAALSARPIEGPIVVVISHYDERPIDDLERLLSALDETPSGWPYRVRIVVNRSSDRQTVLRKPRRHVELRYRENIGFNIGAWEHGWRMPPPAEAYLFLQSECRLLRAGWAEAFVTKANDPGIGLVGERINPQWDRPWPVVERTVGAVYPPDHFVDGRPVDRATCYRHVMARRGIDPGLGADHLQSLILFARRDVLEAVGGFLIGPTKGEAIAAEIGLSKQVQALGLRIAEVGPRPFSWFEHPDWKQPPVGSGRGDLHGE